MKKGEQAQLSAKWWKASQPKGLASAMKLELALRAHDVACAGFEKSKDEPGLKHALDTLDAVEDAAKKAIAEALKGKSAPEMEWTAQALQKLDFKKEAKTLGEGVAETPKVDDEEAKESELRDPSEFGRVMRKWLARIKQDPVNWGFVVGRKPIDHRLLFSKSRNGRTVAVAAAKALGRPAKVSFGTAIRSADDASTLVLTVQGAMLSGLATRIRKMMVKLKPQPIRTVLLMVNGEVVGEVIDPDDVDDDGPGEEQVEDPALEALHDRIAALEPRARAAMESRPEAADRLRATVDQVMAAMAAEDVAGAGSLVDKLEEALARLEGAAPAGAGGSRAAGSGVASSGAAAGGAAATGAAGPGAARAQAGSVPPVPPPPPPGPEGAKLQKSRVAWENTRKSVHVQLQSVETTILAALLKHNQDPAAEDEYDLDEVKSAMPKLYRVLEQYDARLSDKLDEAMQAPAAERARLRAEAVKIVQEYQALLGRDEALTRIDKSGWAPPMKPVIEKTLSVLASSL